MDLKAKLNLRIMTNVRTEEKWQQEKQRLISRFSPRVQEVLKSDKLILPKLIVFENRYLWGDTHTGKTITAHLMLLEWWHQQYLVGNNLGGVVIKVPVLLNQIRTLINTHENSNDLLTKVANEPFLVLDDIGTSKVTDWVLEQLYLLIDHRWECNLPTVFTSNYSLTQLGEQLGDDRIPSRIQAMCKIVKKEQQYVR